MISTPFLLKDIRNELQKAVEGLLLRAPVGNGGMTDAAGGERLRVPRVYYGGLPLRHAPKPVDRRQPPGAEAEPGDEMEDLVPFILVKLLEQNFGAGNPRQETAEIGIVYTVFALEGDPEAGMDDLLSVSDRIVATLLPRRYWADSHWVHETPIKVVNGTGKAESVYASGLQGTGPYYGGAVMTQFVCSAPGQTMPPGIIDANGA